MIDSMVTNARAHALSQDCRLNIIEYSITIAHELAHVMTRQLTQGKGRTPGICSIDPAYGRQKHLYDSNGQVTGLRGESGDFLEVNAFGGLSVVVPDHLTDRNARPGFNLVCISQPEREGRCHKVSEQCLDMPLAGGRRAIPSVSLLLR